MKIPFARSPVVLKQDERHVSMIPNAPEGTQHQLVKITWRDAFATPHGWTSLDDYETQPAEPVTVGWLLPKLLDNYVSTADSILVQNGSVLYYNIGHIPEGMILSIEVLNDGHNDETVETQTKRTPSLLKKGK